MRNLALASAIAAIGALLLCGGVLWFLCAPVGDETKELRRVRHIVSLAAALLLALVGLSLAAHAGPLSIDLLLRDAVELSTENMPTQLALRLVGRINRYRLWLVFDVALALFLLTRSAWRAGGLVIAGALFTEMATATLLIAVRRARPDALDSIQTVFDALTAGSFPPGPVARSFVSVGMALIVMARVARRYFIAAFAAGLLLVTLTGLAQVAIGEHWPSDVLGGYLEGVVCLSAVAIALRFRGDGWRLSSIRLEALRYP
jgi:membrane-associated phospholipid phosphatase